MNGFVTTTAPEQYDAGHAHGVQTADTVGEEGLIAGLRFDLRMATDNAARPVSAAFHRGRFDGIMATVAKREILHDIAIGDVPESVTSYSELHDHVDANGYGHAFEVFPDDEDDALRSELTDRVNRMQDTVNEWLAAGRP